MRTSEKGLQSIIAFEGIELDAYRCPSGIWTIGVGHTGSVDGVPVSAGMKITESVAMDILNEDIKRFEKYLNRQSYIGNLTQGMFDALISFIFNVGISAFETSTMRRMLCANEPIEEVAKQFPKWVFGTVNGKKMRLSGLVKRREAERLMFLSRV